MQWTQSLKTMQQDLSIVDKIKAPNDADSRNLWGVSSSWQYHVED